MAAGFPLVVNNVPIQSSEVLYQACRFPEHPDVQYSIITKRNPMEAKRVARANDNLTRRDWEWTRVLIMKWCLRVKLAQNWESFSSELFATEDMPIVEVSSKDGFWGAIPESGSLCTGANVLGRLLMELREQLKSNSPERFWVVPSLKVNDFKLLGHPIQSIYKPEQEVVIEPKQQRMF